jgi:hypothetical protein
VPIFDGVGTLLTFIAILFRRPRFMDRVFRRQQPDNEALPLVFLIREHGTERFLRDLCERFGQAVPRQVPHVWVDLTEESRVASRRPDSYELMDQAPPTLPILSKLCEGLESDRFGFGRRQHFSRYKLAAWLICQPFGQEVGSDSRRDLVRRLRSFRSGHGATETAFSTVIQNVPDPASKMMLSLFSAVWPALRFWLWVSGSVPGLGRESRWFMRQRYMAPRLSADFLGFADRLTREPRRKEDAEQVDKLLVHAFLEDLRVAYRRRPWRLHTWRRTAYTVILLDNVTDNDGGYQLLRLINAVRNETGQLDPLLVIAASDFESLNWSAELSDDDPIELAGNAQVAWATWQRKLTDRRLLRTPTAWFLPLRVPAPPVAADLTIADREAWTTMDPYVPRRPPWLARRSVVAVAGALSVTAVLLMAAINVAPYRTTNCALPLPWQGVSVQPVKVIVDNEPDLECVGYSDSDHQFFGQDERLQLDQKLIFRQNDQAKLYHEQSPERAYVSVVYFAGLTHPNDQSDSERAQAEELEGLLLQQRQHNLQKSTQPLLRVIIANGGARMKRAPQVVNDMLVPLFRDDPSTLAVIGFDRSVTETQEAIRALGNAGIPMVATTLSADHFDQLSPLLFVMEPTDNKLAELVKEYTRDRKVTIYHPATGRGDIYIDNLVGDLHDTLGSLAGTANGDPQWSNTQNGLGLASLCANQDQDATNKIVFYAGRHEDFGEFLKEVTKGCSGQPIPTILADDAVTRFVANDQIRRDPTLSKISVNYITKASRVGLAGKSCLEGNPPDGADGNITLAAFCSTYKDLYSDLKRELQDRISLLWVGERVGIDYDTAGILLDAVTRNRNRMTKPLTYTPNRAAVIQELTSTDYRETDKTNVFYEFSGVTGWTTFAQSHVASNKDIAIFLIKDIHDLNGRPTCEYMLGDSFKSTLEPPKQDNGCPR